MIYLRFGLLFYFMTLPAFVYLSGRFIQPSKWWQGTDDSAEYADPVTRARIHAEHKTKTGRTLLILTILWPIVLAVAIVIGVLVGPILGLSKIYDGILWIGRRMVGWFVGLAPVPPLPKPEEPFVGGYRVPGKWDVDERTVREIEYEAATEAAAANDVSGDGHGPWRPTTHGGGSR